jgi:formylglycine-generating enzyme required for sulfatase activity
MRKTTLALLLALFFFAAFAEAPAPALPHVVIAGFANRTGDDSFDTPSATATESLALTIRLLGSYEIVAPATAAPGLADKDLLPWCEGESVDYVLYGAIGAVKGGAQEYSLALFDRAKGKTTIRKTAKGTSVFDVFSCADTLTFAVIDAIAGRHVGFGSIAFEVANPGAEGQATVSLDGAKIAEGFGSIDRVVEGRHLVSVSWNAKGAKPKEIALVEIEVAEGECATVPVTLPAKAKSGAAAKAHQATGTNDGMAFVEGGAFTMGSDAGPANERPAREVTVASFWMGKTEVTQGDFGDVYGTIREASDFPMPKHGPSYPMMTWGWRDAIEYCNARSLKEGLTPAYDVTRDRVSWNQLADGYRLPTEAEWEYAAKGGINRDAFAYPGSDDVRMVAVTFKTANGNGLQTVASKKPNSLGLYDMGGNMYEWCWDRYAPYGQDGRKKEGIGMSNTSIVVRGGDSIHGNEDARCASRSYSPVSLNDGVNYEKNKSKYLGFRVVRSVIDEE